MAGKQAEKSSLVGKEDRTSRVERPGETMSDAFICIKQIGVLVI